MSIASTSKASRGGVGGFGGWLSMAPQMDEAPFVQQPIAVMSSKEEATDSDVSPQPSSQRQSPTMPPPPRLSHGGLQPQMPSSAHQASTSYRPPATLVHANNNRRPSAPTLSTATRPKSSFPRTKAKFRVGDSTSVPATPASPMSPLCSHGSGDGDDSPPPFDVRNSFAPMQWGGRSTFRRASDTTDKAVGVSGNRLLQKQPKQRSAGRLDTADPTDDLEGEEYESDGERVEYAGRQWKGKTANAIEQEMEALGDHTVMSYAPDAVYLASRLEGLRRNLEAGADRFRRWAWQDIEDDEPLVEEEEARKSDFAPSPVKPVTLQEGDIKRKSSNELLRSPLVPRSTASPHASPMQRAILSNHQLSPVQEIPAYPLGEAIISEDKNASTIAPQVPSAPIEKAAKEAALDARVEVRTLRRPDLEQVRELHCYHGDGDKVDTETYTTSAAFLLRLLVDEHYVCLVAVAKPLPEPPALPTNLSPRPPPPSLDMPAAKSPLLLAGRRASGLQRQERHRMASSSSQASQRLQPIAQVAALIQESAPAPRSFGAGPDSDAAGSSVYDTSEDEERMRQESLFDAAKAATYATGDTSPPAEMDQDDRSDERMADHDADVAMAEEEKDRMSEDLPSFSSPRIDTSATTIRKRQSTVLAGPTFDVAPPRAIRVMGAPPMGKMPLESEAILGVASARIKVVQRGSDELGSGLHTSWPGIDDKLHEQQQSNVMREAHIMTLSVLPGERGQGLGARLLDLLLDECKRRTAGPRIHLATGSNTISEQSTASAPPRAHQDAPMRTMLEVHPSNTAAVEMYKHRGFDQVQGNKGVVRHFYRGDQRIPSSIRLKVGGSDAIRLERIDQSNGGKLSDAVKA